MVILAFRKWMPSLTEVSPASGGEDDLETILAKEESTGIGFTKAERYVAIGAFFFSGLASMNLQVVWNRAMAMVIGASVYSFSLVLIAFLIGLASGAAVFSRLIKNIRQTTLALALVELCIAAAAMANYLYMDDLPRIFANLVTTHIASFDQHVGVVQFIMFSVAALAVLPATFFMGVTQESTALPFRSTVQAPQAA